MIYKMLLMIFRDFLLSHRDRQCRGVPRLSKRPAQDVPGFLSDEFHGFIECFPVQSAAMLCRSFCASNM